MTKQTDGAACLSLWKNDGMAVRQPKPPRGLDQLAAPSLVLASAPARKRRGAVARKARPKSAQRKKANLAH